MNAAQRIAALALLLISAGSHAARPTSIVFETRAETADGERYAQYLVRCNDGKTVPLTAWDGQRKWCVGEKETGTCQNRQIKAAKTACMEA
jgi:hypothetical protein